MKENRNIQPHQSGRQQDLPAEDDRSESTGYNERENANSGGRDQERQERKEWKKEIRKGRQDDQSKPLL